MVRPRFAKLPPAQQQAILSAASAEFAAHGFHDSSLNRVIETAGISKGSLYYYFDGKEDLYAHVVRVELEQVFARVGPFDLPTDPDPDTYWAALEAYYLQLMTSLEATPQLAALIRGWLVASSTPAMQQLQTELERSVTPWMERVLARGQQIGAVRTDLPSSLLIAVVGGMGQAMDGWLLTQSAGSPDAESAERLPRLISALVGMIRRALRP
ncbi:TetR/AcrR family transcriptional regulator [Microlunatus elymi]|uniref:TetR/AcrR family transcriptional regulator n=1 Tax=Microlunatus elymi TaxID=2596828 RepID=A0A516Q4R4_9ACTN|nr:TetR/AcrR family transcriptional regulator [Microlunatus elymi]QDP98426.1 TetR/AcrR family transcriptional regulator [Microlunatus elymi]